jgi:biotin carboxyl carrier protein
VGEDRPSGHRAIRPSGKRHQAVGPSGEITPLGDGWYLIRDGEKTWRVAAVSDASGTWLFFDGQVAYVGREAAGTRGRAKGRSDAGVMAPMPATVIAINTAAGRSVTEGATVIVLEAMKMELPIKAPRSGVVKAVHCAKGDLVQPGVSLLEIE